MHAGPVGPLPSSADASTSHVTVRRVADDSVPQKGYTIGELLTIIAVVRMRIPRLPKWFSIQREMLENRPWVDAGTFGVLLQRTRRPIPVIMREIVKLVSQQAELNLFGPPDLHNIEASRDRKLRALGAACV